MSSTKPVVIVTRKLPEATEARMQELFDTRLNEDDAPMSNADLVAAMQSADVLVPTVTDYISADLIAQAGERLKLIANYGNGVDNIDLPAARERGISVTNTPGVLTEDTADMTMALLLAVPRRISEGARLLHSGDWKGWSPTLLPGRRIWGKQLGIVGMGRIGTALARRARGFGLEIHYHNRSRLSEADEAGATYHENLDDLLAVSDFLSLHCPATPETTGLMNADRLAKLPQGCVIVNTARGNLIDEAALLQAVESGHVGAAGLDCFVTEPGGNPAFAQHENIMMMPHVGSATVKTRDAMGFKALDNLDAFFRGDTPPDKL